MKCLNRNRTAFWYANLESSEPETDEYGNLTGEMENIYSDPVRAKANISTASGQADVLQFGNSIQYDKVVVLEKSVPINENTHLWIDTMPVIEEDGSTFTPYDYIVKRVARSLNSLSVAVSKVRVDG